MASRHYWNSEKGKEQRKKLAAQARLQRQTQEYPRSPNYKLVREYNQRKQDEFLAICRRYNFCCVACGSHGKLTRDHIRPTVRWGSSHPSNIQPLCRPCNERKATRTIDYRLNAHPHCIAP